MGPRALSRLTCGYPSRRVVQVVCLGLGSLENAREGHRASWHRHMTALVHKGPS